MGFRLPELPDLVGAECDISTAADIRARALGGFVLASIMMERPGARQMTVQSEEAVRRLFLTRDAGFWIEHEMCGGSPRAWLRVMLQGSRE